MCGLPHFLLPGLELLNHGSGLIGNVCVHDVGKKGYFASCCSGLGCFFPFRYDVARSLWRGTCLGSRCQAGVGLRCMAAVPPGTMALLLRVPPVHPAIPGMQPRQSADLLCAPGGCVPVVLWMPSLSPVATRVTAETALLLRSTVLVFSITFGHLSYSVCPALVGSDMS